MEKYGDFIKRISYQCHDLQIGDGRFMPDARVLEKVAEDNSFGSFYGDTVVFDLKEDTKKRIGGIIDILYSEVSECFAQRLDPSTLHMTLHDLSASADLDGVSSDVFKNEISLIDVLADSPVPSGKIMMKTNFIINMVNTSLIMALVPSDEEQWNKLQQLYSLIDKVRVCPYPYLTPHITLAYFSRSGFDEQSAAKLRNIADKLNDDRFDITLDTDDLIYQKFVSMDHYINVFRLTSAG